MMYSNKKNCNKFNVEDVKIKREILHKKKAIKEQRLKTIKNVTIWFAISIGLIMGTYKMLCMAADCVAVFS